MASTHTFDVTTGLDMQEVDNALRQARRELTQRFDFKNVPFAVELDAKAGHIALTAPDKSKLGAIWEVLLARMVRRGVPAKNCTLGEDAAAAGGSRRQLVTLRQSLPTDICRQVVKVIKEAGGKRVQSAMLGEQVRVSASSLDQLQATMAALKTHDFGCELLFGNYR